VSFSSIETTGDEEEANPLCHWQLQAVGHAIQVTCVRSFKRLRRLLALRCSLRLIVYRLLRLRYPLLLSERGSSVGVQPHVGPATRLSSLQPPFPNYRSYACCGYPIVWMVICQFFVYIAHYVCPYISNGCFPRPLPALGWSCSSALLVLALAMAKRGARVLWPNTEASVPIPIF
jgi:hypothetical protein